MILARNIINCMDLKMAYESSVAAAITHPTKAMKFPPNTSPGKSATTRRQKQRHAPQNQAPAPELYATAGFIGIGGPPSSSFCSSADGNTGGGVNGPPGPGSIRLASSA